MSDTIHRTGLSKIRAIRALALAGAAWASFCPMVAIAQTALPSEAASDDTTAKRSDIIVTGTRQSGRTVENSAAPIDVLGQVDIQRTGQTNAFDALSSLLPSFSLPASGGDLSRLVRAARLRGLSPDQTLVLVDGKRRHISASINTNVGPVAGSDPADLDLISQSMIDHVEVLRDGAAAQYGSDAIAGVINIITKKAPHGGSAYAQTGSYYRGDGFSASGGANLGFALGAGGYVNLSADYRYHGHSNRCGLDPRAATFGLTKNPCKTAGDPRYNVFTTGVSAGYDFGSVELYGVGTYAHRASEGFTGWRLPNRYASPWYQANYKEGFVPAEVTNEDDFALTTGLRGDVGGWKWDLSSTYGADNIQVYNQNDLNRSLITNTGYLVTPIPYRTRAGTFADSEWTNNLDISRELDTGVFASPLTVAFGAEFRRNGYIIRPGEYNSYFGYGASAYPGLNPANATDVHRTNKALYVDLAADVAKGWQVDVAGRFERYSDFGDTWTGKVTTRYDFSRDFAVRGTVSTGFRAPTLAQAFQTALNVGPTAASGQLPASSPAAIALGSSPLRPEKSTSLSFGFTAQPLAGFHVAVDAYQIRIRDQISNSGLIGAARATNPALYNTAVAALQLAGFTIDPAVTQVFAQFYTNGLGTRTRGIDLTADYRSGGPWGGHIDWSLSANVNRVHLTRVDTFPSGAAKFSRDVLSEITQDSPRDKVIVQAAYTDGNWGLTLRETRWGRTSALVADATLGPPTYYTNMITPKYLTDIQISYRPTPVLELSAGATNLFDVYPNKTEFGTRNVANTLVYPINSPFGFNGGSFYGRLAVKF